jgi:hypothetical protein
MYIWDGKTLKNRLDMDIFDLEDSDNDIKDIMEKRRSRLQPSTPRRLRHSPALPSPRVQRLHPVMKTLHVLLHVQLLRHPFNNRRLPLQLIHRLRSTRRARATHTFHLSGARTLRRPTMKKL